MPAPRDDSLMNRFDEHGLRRFSARDAVVAVAIAAALLVVLKGDSVRAAGRQMSPGIGRDLVLAIGRPAGWIADRTPLADAADRATASLSPDADLRADAGFDSDARVRAGAADEIPPVTSDAFDPATIGARTVKRPLETLLVTGDSMSMPLDKEIARRLSASGIRVVRDPHLGTGISKPFLVDWGRLSSSQMRKYRPDAVVLFVGANEGYPMKAATGDQVECCGADWAAIYANRARRMASTYRQRGAARLYWIKLPAPRDEERQKIARVVNAAVDVAVAPWRAQVRVLDTSTVFTPRGYRDAMEVAGRETIVRQPDGIHLNEAGARLLADLVMERIDQDFTR